MKTVLLQLLAACLVSGVSAEVQMDPVEYKQGDTLLRGYFAYDTEIKGKRPGVLVVHAFWGLNDYARMRAKKLAEEGYVTLALDMYGDGKSSQHPQEASEWAKAIGENQKLAFERFMAAYEVLKQHDLTDSDKIAAIGYCFGGSIVLKMALHGADLDAVVSFHGGFPSDPIEGDVKASVLVCHGAADSMATPEQIQAFRKNLTEAGVDWELNVYAHARHAFTNPVADEWANEWGWDTVGYNARADKRSWRAMLGFLDDAFD